MWGRAQRGACKAEAQVTTLETDINNTQIRDTRPPEQQKIDVLTFDFHHQESVLSDGKCLPRGDLIKHQTDVLTDDKFDILF